MHGMLPRGAVKLTKGVASGVGQRWRRAAKLGQEEDDDDRLLGHARTASIFVRSPPKFEEGLQSIKQNFPTCLISNPTVGWNSRIDSPIYWVFDDLLSPAGNRRPTDLGTTPGESLLRLVEDWWGPSCKKIQGEGRLTSSDPRKKKKGKRGLPDDV